jgi:kumamolisin
MSVERLSLAGSDRRVAEGHAKIGDYPADEQLTVSVYLRERPDSGGLAWVDEEAGLPLSERRTLSQEEWAAAHGAAPEDLEALRSFAADHGLTVVEEDAGRRRVALSGTVGAISDAFGAEVARYRSPEGTEYRGRVGALRVPATLAPALTAVLGIDNRPQARTHHRRPHQSTAGYAPTAVASAYAYPSAANGAGQAVALIELGGGFVQSDLDTYFSGLGLTSPPVTAVAVDGGTNSPGDPNGPDGEVMLDIEIVGSVANGASIAVYFAPNTDQGFIDAVTQAVHDTTVKPHAVSISWGGPENTWTAQAANQMEQAFVAAAALGVTVTVAAGDNGSTDGVSDGQQHVDFPASAPHALACGGTSLQLTSSDTISGETVWNDLASGHGATGGGVSALFALPSYQANAGVPNSANPGGGPGRGVPDVAGNADPLTGYQIRVDGQDTVIGGTSAVAPLWAGLVARLNQALGQPVGFLQPSLYQATVTGTFHDITAGSNGAYQALAGWDACTGLGSPDGAALLAALGGKPAT